eukprot:9234979-Heterocapsa_arctica.AAC.1
MWLERVVPLLSSYLLGQVCIAIHADQTLLEVPSSGGSSSSPVVLVLVDVMRGTRPWQELTLLAVQCRQ